MKGEFKAFCLIMLGIVFIGFIAMSVDADGKRACRQRMVDKGYPVADIITLCGK